MLHVPVWCMWLVCGSGAHGGETVAERQWPCLWRCGWWRWWGLPAGSLAQPSALAERWANVGESRNSHFSSRLVPLENFIKGAGGRGGEVVEKWGKWDWGKWEIRPQLSRFSPIFLPFPTNFAHFFYTPHNVFLAISHNSPKSPPPPVSPHYPPFSPSSPKFPPFFHFPPIFLHLCG